MNIVGVDRMFKDLSDMNYSLEIRNAQGIDYIVIKDYLVQLGQFKDRVIDIALPVPKDYPRAVVSCVHVKSDPVLLDNQDSIRGKRNIINSPLGENWRYWSFKFSLSSINPTQYIMSQVNGIFKNI